MTTIILLLAVSLLLAAVFSMKAPDQGSADMRSELKDLVYEARLARDDLEAMLVNVQAAGEDMVKVIDEKLSERFKQLEDRLEKAAEPAVAADEGTVPAGDVVPLPPFPLEDMRRAHPYLMAPRLKDMGYSIVQIAEFLGRSTGEIELIISISEKKQKCG